MKVKWQDEEILALSEIDKQVICNDIHEDEFEADMKRRLRYILQHKIERCEKRLVDEWLPKLRADSSIASIPNNRDGLLQLIFSHPQYKCRKTRELEAEAARAAERQ